MCPFTATIRYRRDIEASSRRPWTWRKTMRRVTAAAIPVNWDYPVWKCGNLVSTADVLSIPEPPQLIGHAGHCFAFHDRIKFSFHSSVPQCRDHTRCFHLWATALSCTRTVYLPPSLLLIPLSLFLPPLFIPRSDTATNFWRGQRFAPRAFYFKGTITFMPYRACIYFREANHRIPLQDVYSFNGTCRRGLNRTWPKFHRFSRELISASYIRFDKIFGLTTLFE